MLAAAMAARCDAPPAATDAAPLDAMTDASSDVTTDAREGPDLFRLAINGSPTGSFLSAWGSGLRAAAYIAGGFVGVDHARLPANAVGRLVEYTTGAFRTVCLTDEVLWWTFGAPNADRTAEAVYAVGEGGRVLRYRDGRCETLHVDLTYPEGAPTFWGVYGTRDDDLWLVGGSARPEGPRGVVVHYDGVSFTRETALPPEAASRNLYKIDGAVDGRLFVVGEGALTLVRDPRTRAWSRVANNVAQGDDRLFTVSCPRSAPYDCWAVGGVGGGLVLSGNAAGFSRNPNLVDLPGLSGVWVQDDRNIWAVGSDGFTMHFDGHVNGRIQYHPTRPLTEAMLHGVGGIRNSVVILAVGGELGVATPEQRGVILIRGDDSARFQFDGRSYDAAGSLRRTIGGWNQ